MVDIKLEVEKYGSRKRWMAVIPSTKDRLGMVFYHTYSRYKLERWVAEHEEAGRIRVLNRL